MKIEIFDPKSEEWQKVCAPVQREMTAERGGIIIVILAKEDKESRSLSDFAIEAQKLNKMPLLGVEFENIYDLYSNDYYKAYELVYQIYSKTDKSFQNCFKLAANLLDLLGKFFISERQTKTVVA